MKFITRLVRDLRDFAPTESEEGPWRGALSTFAEWHAIGIGLGVGIAVGLTGKPELMGVLAAYALGVEEAGGGQLADLAKEPAYALAAASVGYLLASGVVAL